MLSGEKKYQFDEIEGEEFGNEMMSQKIGHEENRLDKLLLYISHWNSSF